MDSKLIILFIILMVLFLLIYTYYLNFNIFNVESFSNDNYKIIENRILKKTFISEKKIPKLILQTYKDNKVNPIIHKNIIQMLNKNKDYSYLLITDSLGQELINKYFDKRVLNAFNCLNIGAAKGDFLRYIGLYIYGGIYIDMDSSINGNLDDYINFNYNFMFFMDRANNLEQWCIITKSKNLILKKIILTMVERIENRENNIFLATGPTLFTDVIYNMINNSNIYDTNVKLTSYQRYNLFMKNKKFMGGRISKRTKNENLMFSFRFKNYNTKILYPKNDKYQPSWNQETPYLYKK